MLTAGADCQGRENFAEILGRFELLGAAAPAHTVNVEEPEEEPDDQKDDEESERAR